LGIVLSKLQIGCTVHEVDADLKTYVQQFCALDVLRLHPLGSPFVAFTHIRNTNGRSALLFKISHAQYDEICLPNMLHQLSALYEGKQEKMRNIPFSSFVKHVVQNNLAESKAYWANLLRGASMTVVKPDMPLTSRKAISIFKTFDIAARSRSTTIATLPTAAWAICLGKTLALQDVVFGEVVSGRNTGFVDADITNGPCWQYIPVRVRLQHDMTFAQVLQLVQNQHIASNRFENMGLEEIRKECTDWPETVDWFGSVVHQDVEHVTQLPFQSASADMETIYPHLEILREVKCQCFVSGSSLTFEIVIYESWRSFGMELMDNLAEALRGLVSSSHSSICLYNCACQESKTLSSSEGEVMIRRI
jgi:hypothetical protein